jgi:hypothetical protein
VRSNGFLIDDQGRTWSESSRELVRRIGYRDPLLDIPAYAVRRGLIHVDVKGSGVRVSLCAGRFSSPALAGALRRIHERSPSRIMLAVLSGDEWRYGICANVAELAAQAEEIAADKPIGRRPWLAIEKDIRAIAGSPTFGRADPIVRLWQRTRGRLSDDLVYALRQANLLDRSVIARPNAAASRLIIEHFGCGFTGMMEPCKSLALVGRELGAGDYDQRYGAWVSETYARALSERRLHLASIDATFQVSADRSIRARYDRALIPWMDRSGERLILGISINRSLSTQS